MDYYGPADQRELYFRNQGLSPDGQPLGAPQAQTGQQAIGPAPTMGNGVSTFGARGDAPQQMGSMQAVDPPSDFGRYRGGDAVRQGPAATVSPFHPIEQDQRMSFGGGGAGNPEMSSGSSSLGGIPPDTYAMMQAARDRGTGESRQQMGPQTGSIQPSPPSPKQQSSYRSVENAGNQITGQMGTPQRSEPVRAAQLKQQSSYGAAQPARADTANRGYFGQQQAAQTPKQPMRPGMGGNPQNVRPRQPNPAMPPPGQPMRGPRKSTPMGA